MDLDWKQESTAGVTLVSVRLENERGTDRRARLRNRLDGPVLPPRRHGTPESGWDHEGVTRVVPAGETVALGYACPAPEAEPPVAVDDVGPVTEDGPGRTVAATVRERGDHRPPRAVLGDGADPGAASQPEVGADGLAADDPGERRQRPDRSPDRSQPHQLPDEVTSLLDRYRGRIRTAEALTAAGVVEATALIEANGGLEGAESVAAELDSDARELRALARVADALADRATATAPPTDALRRLS